MTPAQGRRAPRGSGARSATSPGAGDGRAPLNFLFGRFFGASAVGHRRCGDLRRFRCHVACCQHLRAFRCCSSNKPASEANGARSSVRCSVRCVAAVKLPAARARGATGHRRAWHVPRFVPRPVARRRLLVFSTTAARACLSSQHTARERTRSIPSRARGLFMLIVGNDQCRKRHAIFTRTTRTTRENRDNSPENGRI